MPWKQINGTKYYYRHVRKGDKIRSEYIGTGEVADLVAQADQWAIQARRAAAASWRETRNEHEDDDRNQAATYAAIGVVIRRALEAAGFHQHKRGQWRRRRVGNEIAGQSYPIKPAMSDETREVILRVMVGRDETALPEFRQIMEAEPGPVIFAANTYLTLMMESSTIAKIAGKYTFLKETLPLLMKAKRDELAGPNATAIERMLAERAVKCWLDLTHWDLRFDRAANLNDGQEDYLDKMRARAERRYLAALRELAQVRKLNLVAIQVNIDRQHINIEKGEQSLT
jgi:hypothetical protein